MPASGENVTLLFAEILADSHVSAVAIAVLLFRSLDYAFWLYGSRFPWRSFIFQLSPTRYILRPLHVIHYVFISLQFFRVPGRSPALVALGLRHRATPQLEANIAADWQGETMLDRLKQAFGRELCWCYRSRYLFAQGVLHFVNIFVSPVAGWVSRKEYGGLVPRTTSLPGFSLQDSLPELVRFVLLLLVWYVLLRWLYFKPIKKEPSEPAPIQNKLEAVRDGSARL